MNKVSFDEDFLLKRCRNMNLNFKLPLRLQKRQLLEKLNFPKNLELYACQVTNLNRLNRLFSEFMEKPPFLIIVSEKPMKTLTTPLFTIDNNKKILYRNQYNKNRKISDREVIEIISSYFPKSWVEFTQPLWKEKAIAGRLLYYDSNRQLLEIQEGIIPAHLAYVKEKVYFNGELEFFSYTKNLAEFHKTKENLQEMGYKIFPLRKIQCIAESLLRLMQGFEKLKAISSLPTLEFAWDKKTGLISVDIDWPNQFLF